MERYRMIDIVSLVGLPYPQQGRSSYNVPCPNCDNGRGKHLNINLKKEVFRCPKCGISGGIFDLYSLFTGVPRQQARSAISQNITPEHQTYHKRESVPESQTVECPLADIELRHQVYSAFMSKLILAPDHKQNLLNRGLTETEITELGYKTTPVAGAEAIAKQLSAEGYCLEGIPGFYRGETDHWKVVIEQRGIYIPVRDLSGRIQGLQIRRDNASKRKFRWFSSSERNLGCSAKSWVHIVGPVQKTVVLTEGAMKSDIINKLSGFTVVAVQGVNSLSQLRPVLEELQNLGVEEIKTAFDMDMMVNWHVQNAYHDLIWLLSDAVPHIGTFLWDPRFKGLDDYLWEYCYQKKR